MLQTMLAEMVRGAQQLLALHKGTITPAMSWPGPLGTLRERQHKETSRPPCLCPHTTSLPCALIVSYAYMSAPMCPPPFRQPPACPPCWHNAIPPNRPPVCAVFFNNTETLQPPCRTLKCPGSHLTEGRNLARWCTAVGVDTRSTASRL